MDGSRRGGSRRGARPPALLALVALSLPATSLARQELGHATGDAHLVRVVSAAGRGLEAGIPRDSWYARGIAADIKGRWDESYAAYRKARDEFGEQIRTRPRWADMIRGWKLKASYMQRQSSRLRSYARRSRYSSYRSPTTTLNYAAALHNKWLAIRAFTGRNIRRLADKALAAYRQGLRSPVTSSTARHLRRFRRGSHYDRHRLGLAALYHELGQHDRARRELGRVTDRDRRYLALQLAYYYTAAGDVDQAFRHLERAVRHSSSNRRYALRSNDFDRLRGDPRFRNLVGKP